MIRPDAYNRPSHNHHGITVEITPCDVSRGGQPKLEYIQSASATTVFEPEAGLSRESSHDGLFFLGVGPS